MKLLPSPHSTSGTPTIAYHFSHWSSSQLSSSVLDCILSSNFIEEEPRLGWGRKARCLRDASSLKGETTGAGA